MLKKPSAIIDFVKMEKNKFEEVSKNYQNINKSHDVAYTILDYEKIINEIYDYITSFCEYKKNGETKYSDRIMTTTKCFYDKMFGDKDKYRSAIALSDFPHITKQFLVCSKKLQSLFDELSESTDKDTLQIIYLSDNQLKKIIRVFNDDMEIYLWLSTSGSKIINYPISDSVRSDYININTPVMHVKQRKDN